MSRALLVLANDTIRRKAALWCEKLPKDTRVEFKGPKRTIPQNDRMWAMCTDVSQQILWYGVKLSPEDWKLLFLDDLGRELRMAPSLDGKGFVNLGRSSSKLSIEEMTDLIELIFKRGAELGVVFSDESKTAA